MHYYLGQRTAANFQIRCPDRFISEENNTSNTLHCKLCVCGGGGGEGGWRSGAEPRDKNKILCPFRDSNPEQPAYKLILIRT